MTTTGNAALAQHVAHHLGCFAADYPAWTVYTAGGDVERRTWVAVPLPAGTPLAVARRIRSGRIIAETPTALRAALDRHPRKA